MLHAARQEGGVGLIRGGAGVWADLLADIAAKDPVAELRPQLARDRAALLDGLEGEAARGVDGVGRDDGPGRAAIEADAAAAAVLVEGRIRLQIELQQQLAQHHPRAMPGHDDAGVLAIPAQPGAGRDGAIDDAARGRSGNGRRPDSPTRYSIAGVQGAACGRQERVVIRAAGIAADAAAGHAVIWLARILPPVGDADGEDGERLGDQRLLDRTTPRALGGEPGHARQWPAAMRSRKTANSPGTPGARDRGDRRPCSRASVLTWRVSCWRAVMGGWSARYRGAAEVADSISEVSPHQAATGHDRV